MKKALESFKRASQAGVISAYYKVGTFYLKGLGVKKDLDKALYWLKQAAMKGESNSQFNLGVAYYKGLGVPQDILRAYEWVSKAAKNGNSQAKTVLPKLKEQIEKISNKAFE